LKKDTNRILTFLSSISLLLITYGLFELKGIPPEGYVASIYDQLPLRLYLILLFCYFSSCILVLSYRKTPAIIILLLIHFTVLIIPYMLGYVSIGRYGEFSYMGLAENNGFFDISGSSAISTLSPTGPLLVLPLDLISGLGAQTLYHFLPIFFSIQFIAGMFMLCRTYMLREKLVGLTLLSSFLLYFWRFQFSVFPYYLSFCMIPIYLFVLKKALSDKNRTMLISFLFMITLLPLAHPFIFVYIICFSLLLMFSGKILNRGRHLSKIFFDILVEDNVSNSNGRKVVFLSILTFTSGSILFCAKYASRFSQILPHDFSRHVGTLSVTGLTNVLEIESNLEFIHYFNLYYGKYYIPLIFIVINSIIVWQNRKRFCHHFIHTYPSFLVLYVGSFFIEWGFLLNPFNPYPAERFANLSFIIFAQIPLLAYSLYIIFLRKGNVLGFASVVLILCLLWTFGFFSCFSSPYTDGVSEGVSQNEVRGMQWLSRVKTTPDCVISYEDKNMGNAVLSGSTSNLKNSDLIPFETSSGFMSVPKYYSEDIIHLKNSSENEPFYFVVTTFSKDLSLNESRSETQTSVGNVFIPPESYPLRKIYDSLNIEIYEHAA
jgi:hypothetical protein